MNEIIFRITHLSRDNAEESELISEERVEARVQEILSFTRNVIEFELTVQRIQ